MVVRLWSQDPFLDYEIVEPPQHMAMFTFMRNLRFGRPSLLLTRRMLICKDEGSFFPHNPGNELNLADFSHRKVVKSAFSEEHSGASTHSLLHRYSSRTVV